MRSTRVNIGGGNHQTLNVKKRLLGISCVVWLGLLLPPLASTAQISGPRKVNLLLTDNAYSPNTTLKVRKGETVVFTFVNKGKVLHEALVGTPAVQAAHEKEMAGMGTMAMADEKDRVSMKPGQTKKLTFKFDKVGRYQIGCHQPTHYKLGMKVAITVS